MTDDQIAEEVVGKICERGDSLAATPIGELIGMADDSIDVILDSSGSGVTEAQKILDNAVLIAAVGLVIAVRAAKAEDHLYREDP